ncbi:MAG: hypothetical protein ACXQTR_01820 [Candidatus Methanospirareceae archaeon]
MMRTERKDIYRSTWEITKESPELRIEEPRRDSMYATKEQREDIYRRMRETVREFPELRDMNWGIVSGFEDKGFSDRWNVYVATMTTSTISNAPWKATRFWEDLEEEV